jgi:hypothetical protein
VDACGTWQRTSFTNPAPISAPIALEPGAIPRNDL